VETRVVAAERHAGDVAGIGDDVLAGVFFRGPERDAAGGGQPPALEGEFVDDVRAGAGGEQPLPARIPDEAQPRVIDVDAADDLQVLGVEDADRRLRTAAGG